MQQNNSGSSNNAPSQPVQAAGGEPAQTAPAKPSVFANFKFSIVFALLALIVLIVVAVLVFYQRGKAAKKSANVVDWSDVLKSSPVSPPQAATGATESAE